MASPSPTAAGATSGRQRVDSAAVTTGSLLHLSASEKKRAAAEIKRDILLKCKTDWEFSLPSSTNTPDSAVPRGEHDQTYEDVEDSAIGESPSLSSVTYRERDLSTSESSDVDKEAGGSWTEDARMHYKRRRRQKLLEEEMKWNTGLQNWMAQRDAWTGGRVIYFRPDPPSQSVSTEDHQEPSHDASSSSSSSALFSSSSSQDRQDVITSRDFSLDIGSRVDNQREKDIVSKIRGREVLEGDEKGERIELVPVPPSLFSSANPLRQTPITPKQYPTIYTRLVVQSSSPNVPINLADLTKVMWDGWKREGLLDGGTNNLLATAGGGNPSMTAGGGGGGRTGTGATDAVPGAVTSARTGTATLTGDATPGATRAASDHLKPVGTQPGSLSLSTRSTMTTASAADTATSNTPFIGLTDQARKDGNIPSTNHLQNPNTNTLPSLFQRQAQDQSRRNSSMGSNRQEEEGEGWGRQNFKVAHRQQLGPSDNHVAADEEVQEEGGGGKQQVDADGEESAAARMSNDSRGSRRRKGNRLSLISKSVGGAVRKVLGLGSASTSSDQKGDSGEVEGEMDGGGDEDVDEEVGEEEGGEGERREA